MERCLASNLRGVEGGRGQLSRVLEAGRSRDPGTGAADPPPNRAGADRLAESRSKRACRRPPTRPQQSRANTRRIVLSEIMTSQREGDDGSPCDAGSLRDLLQQ